ncbi:MAG TPA: hypothetical protein VEA63_10665 [Opitutus sp.]|nr:hypothetical protein [Opitutus sp.]
MEIYILRSWLCFKDVKLAALPGVKKALSSGAFTPESFAAAAKALGKNPTELGHALKLGAGLVPLSAATDSAVTGFRVKDFAHRVWVQLTTRVIARKFNWEHDDLAKVYDSWYEFFRYVRSLAEEAMFYREADTALANEVRSLVIDELLDAIMRPHLTNHPRRFRHWLEHDARNTQEFASLEPQELQRKYPKFALLQADLIETQNKISGVEARLVSLLFPQPSSQDGRTPPRFATE